MAPVVLIDDNPERAKWGTEQGMMTLIADATKDETLREARIEKAKGLVAAISSDAENVYVTLSAKVLNPQLHIAARASDDQAEEKLRRAGATTVLTPYSFIGHRLAQSMLRPHVISFLDVASAYGRRTSTWKSNNCGSHPKVFWWITPSTRRTWAGIRHHRAGRSTRQRSNAI